MISQKTKTSLIFAIIILNILGTKAIAGRFEDREANIQYLAHTDLDISDSGINRLHFANSRIVATATPLPVAAQLLTPRLPLASFVGLVAMVSADIEMTSLFILTPVI